MKFDRDWLNRIYQAPVGDEGSPAAASVQPEIENTVDTSTVLTKDSTAVDTTAEDAAATDAPADVESVDGDSEQTGEGSQTHPEAYADFAMPEGVELDSELLAEAAPIFKELKLSQEQAQKLVDFQAKQVQAGEANRVDAFNQLMNDWQTESKNDKEFGGDKFDENVKVAQSAINKFGTPGLKQLLEEHGVGNHPEVIRFMVKVGKLTSEDVPGGTTTPNAKPQDRVSLLYPK